MLWKWTLNHESQSWLTDLNLALGILVSHRGPCQLGLRSSSMIRLFKGTWEDSESRLSHSPLNPWIGKFCSCPFVANLPRLTQFHYWSAGNETNFFLHGKIPCGLLWLLKWPLKGFEGFKFEAWRRSVGIFAVDIESVHKLPTYKIVYNSHVGPFHRRRYLGLLLCPRHWNILFTKVVLFMCVELYSRL